MREDIRGVKGEFMSDSYFGVGGNNRVVEKLLILCFKIYWLQQGY
jgi:hypothetical protein